MSEQGLVERLRDNAHLWRLGVMDEAADRIEALEAALREAQKDAARLDWLESTLAQRESDTGQPCGWYVDETGAPIISGALEALWAKTLRAAIDAARKVGTP